MSLNPVNVLIFLGVFQSLVIITLIIMSKSFDTTHNKLLVVLLAVVGISLIPTFLGNSGLIERYHFLAFIPLHLALFTFPVLYLYFKSIFEQPNFSTKNVYFHFLIPGSYWIYSAFIWIQTLNSLTGKGLIAGKFYYFEIYRLYPLILVLVVGYYSICSFQVITAAQNKGLTKEQTKFHKWLEILALVFLIGFVLDFSSVVLGQIYGHWRGTAFDEWLGIPFSMLVKVYYAVLIYLVATIGYAKFTQPKIKKSKLMSYDVQSLLFDITSLMENKKLYLDTNFALPKMANELNTTVASVSAALNNEMNISFNDFVNKYRVEEVKNKLETGALNKYTLAAVAEEAGFKSKATFYRAFQKFTGQSPTSYMENSMTVLK